jgi:Starch/carbohydrate-binding module (family 53)
MIRKLSLLGVCLGLFACGPASLSSEEDVTGTVGAELGSGDVELVYAHAVTRGCSSCISWQGFLAVKDLAYEKDVAVVYSMDSGSWREASARFVETLPDGRELWTFERVGWPGDFRFALRYRAAGREYWDNAGGLDYRGKVALSDGRGLATVDAPLGVGRDVAVTSALVADPMEGETGPSLHVYLRVRNRAYDKRVRIVYSVDGWNTVAEAEARYEYGGDAQQWFARIPLDPDARAVDFAAVSLMAGSEDWDNNFGRNFRCAADAISTWRCDGALLR